MTISELLKRRKELSRFAGSQAESLHTLPPGELVAAEAIVNHAYQEMFELEARIRVAPATNLAEVIAKVSIALGYAGDELGGDEELDANWQMVQAAMEDLEALAEPPLTLGQSFGPVEINHGDIAMHLHQHSGSSAASASGACA